MKNTRKILLVIIAMLFALVACTDKKEKDIFEQIFDSINLPEYTTEDVNLPNKSSLEPKAKFYWTTDNYRVINNKGMFTRPDEDVEVNLELMLTIGMETKVKEYQVIGKGWEEYIIDQEVFKDPAGFASLGITNRANLSSEVLVANNEIEFIKHLIDTRGKKDVVIKITKDLNMGAKNVGKLLVKEGLWDGNDPKKTPYLDGKVFRENTNLPTLHPILLEQGVGQLIIDGRDGLMIYSETGVVIKHLTTHIKGNSKNIVFRNLSLQGIWEWDEIDRGDYKALDWDYFTIEQAQNIWLDHLTFRTAYDGIVDVKGGTKNITLSWLNLDFIVDDFIQAQFDWLEKNQNVVPFYRELRQDVSKENIAIIAAGQKKGFNFGNTEGGPGFEEITITMHNIYAKNLQDRFPRLRRGDVHVYNVVLDSEQLQDLKDDRMKVISQGLIPTEQGAILMENSKFIGVNEPIKTHQASNIDSDFTGRFEVRNSEYINKADYYLGSSTDDNFENPWKRSNNNVNYDLDFYFRNYQNVPYDYTLKDARKLTKVFSDNLMGAGKMDGFNWLEIKKLVDPNTVEKGKKIDEARIEGIETHIASINDKFKMYDPVLYNFYTGKKFETYEYDFNIDNNGLDLNKAGIYQVKYYLYLVDNPNEVIEYVQTYVVFDPIGANEIYDYEIEKPFDNMLSGSLDVYLATGNLYYYLSNEANEDGDTIRNKGTIIEIDNTTVHFSNIDVSKAEFIHFVVVSKDLVSQELAVEIEKETIVEIKTNFDFGQMISSRNSKGNYYILMNDLDFTNYELPYLDAETIFNGVFDGNGFKVSNIVRHAYGGGIFHTIGDGKIKNITFDNIQIDINETEIIDEDGIVTGIQKTSARAGIVAGQIKGGLGILDNIVIMNSKLTTNNNYGGILIGKVEGHSSAIIRNITVLNSEVYQEGEYAGGLIAGIENDTTSLIEDIYINGLTVYEGKNKMVGVIVGRMSTGTTIRRVVAIDVKVTTEAAIGGVLGKDDRKSQTIDVSISDVFINLVEANTSSHYLGNIIGNPDVNEAHPQAILSNIWGTKVNTGSSGLSTSAENTVDLSTLDNTWWATNFKNLIETNLWEVSDGIIKLK